MPDSVTETFSRSIPAAICCHFSRLLQCYVCYLRADNSVRCAFVSGQPSSCLDDGKLFAALFGKQKISGRPGFRLTRPGEIYISVDLFQRGKFCGRLVAGPIMRSFAPSSDPKGKAAVSGNFDFAVSAAALLYYFVYEKWIDTGELYNAAISAKTLPPQKKPEKDMPAEIQHTPRAHHTAAYENQVYNLITQGNPKSLAKAIGTPPDGVYGLLDKRHPLRNLKDDCICTLTLATRAAIAGGLDSETAFSISDGAIQSVEIYDNVDELARIVEQTLFRLANLVESIHSFHYSYRINYCRNYIMQHVYEKLTVPQIAAHAGVSPEYLTEQFKKETGVCLKLFMEQVRIHEAKRLLQSTGKSLLEITLMLNFHDQSHFIRSFKKITYCKVK
jgi:AraC-like DNA-binding protein